MPTISTCLIVKNESVCIERCLNSILLFSDEIIIYDTGSNDGTQEICSKIDKVRVIQGEWRNDFAWARNESFKHATCDYIMWVDADDYITEENARWLLNFKNTELEKYTQVNLEYIYDIRKWRLTGKSIAAGIGSITAGNVCGMKDETRQGISSSRP